MERTEPLEILAGSGQCHVVTHDLRDVHSVSDLVDDVVRNQALPHGGPRLCPQESNQAAAGWSALSAIES